MPLSSKPSNYSLRSAPVNPTEPEPEPEPVRNLNSSISTQEHFNMPMAGAFRMDDFNGDGTQDIVRYLGRFDEYTRATGLKDDQATASLAWHLKGLARLWYESLATRPGNIDELKDLLKAKFKMEKEINLDIYNMRQSPGETVNQFLNRLEQATYLYKIQGDVQVQIALKGMERSLGQAIGAHAPKSLQDVRNLAARMGDIPSEVTPSVNATGTSKLEETVQQLVAAVANLTVEKNNRENSGEGRRQMQTERPCSRCGAKANLTKHELRTYYEKVKAILSEFCTDVPDIEYMIESLAYEHDVISPGSSASSNSLLSPIYQDPEVQTKFEQFCLEQYGKNMNFKRNKCTEAGEGGSDKPNGRHGNYSPRQAVTMKQTNGGDEMSATLTALPSFPHKEVLEITGYANPTRQPVADPNISKEHKKPVSDTWKIPVVSDNKDDPDFNNPTQQHMVFSPVPRLQLPKSPDDDVMSVLGHHHPPSDKSIKEECLNDGNVLSHLQPVINKDVISGPVCSNQTWQPGSSSLKCETMKKPDVNPKLLEVPVFTCPSKQHVVFSPVLRQTLETPTGNKDQQEATAFANPPRQPMVSSPVKCKTQGGPDNNTESQDLTAFANPTRQPVGIKFVKGKTTKKPAANPASKEVPVFTSPSRQPVLFSPVMRQAQEEPDLNTELQEATAFANPTRQPMASSPVIRNTQGEPDFNTKSQEVTVFANPTRQPVGNNSVRNKNGKKPAANPASEEVPVFKSPSRQPVVFSPVMRQAQDRKPSMNTETQEDQLFANPTRQPVVISPVMRQAQDRKPSMNTETQEDQVFANPTRQPVVISSVMRQAQGGPVFNTESQEVTAFANPTRQPVGINSARYKTSKKPAANSASEEVPVFTDPSRQPVVFSPVMCQAQDRKPPMNTETQEDQVFANPTRQPVVISSVMHQAQGEPDFNTKSQEVTAFANPTRQPVGNNSVKDKTIMKSAANPTSEEVPVFTSPSRQRVVFSPVMHQVQGGLDFNTESQEVTAFANPTRQPVESVSVKCEAMRKPAVNQDLMEVPVFKSPSRQPVVFSPVMRPTPMKHDVNAEGHEVPMVISPSRQPVVFSPVRSQAIERPDLDPETQEGTMFANPTRPHLYTPQNEMALSIVGDHSVHNPNEHPESHSPVKSQSRMLGKINKGLLTRKNVTSKPKVPSKKSNASENGISKSANQIMELKVGTTNSIELSGNQRKSDNRKPNVMRKCIDKLNGKKDHANIKRPNVIKVKPASPGCTARNTKKFLSQKPVLSHRAKKKVISQTNLRPDKGIVWPTELEGLSRLNKAYYVEQFLRTELFKQRCKRKEKGGSVWMNGLSKFQLWVIENQGTDAIEAVLDTVPKNKTDAVAKVQCWRSDSPEY